MLLDYQGIKQNLWRTTEAATGGLLLCNFIKKRLQRRCFRVKFAKLSKTPISINIWEQLLLVKLKLIIICSPYQLRWNTELIHALTYYFANALFCRTHCNDYNDFWLQWFLLRGCSYGCELARLGRLARLGERIFIPRSYGIFYLSSIKKFVMSLEKDCLIK